MLHSRLTLLAGVTMFAVAAPAMAQQDTAASKPVEAVTHRAANPSGPFAILTSVQRDSIIDHTRSLLGV